MVPAPRSPRTMRGRIMCRKKWWRTSRHGFCRAKSPGRWLSRSERPVDLTFECEWKAKLQGATMRAGSVSRTERRCLYVPPRRMVFWLACSALQPEDAHTVVSFTATSETLAHLSLYRVFNASSQSGRGE